MFPVPGPALVLIIPSPPNWICMLHTQILPLMREDSAKPYFLDSGYSAPIKSSSLIISQNSMATVWERVFSVNLLTKHNSIMSSNPKIE